MKGQKKSQRSQRSRDIARAVLAIIPLPFALSLTLFPELGELYIAPTIIVFAFGTVLGTITHIYWLRVLLQERDFYKKFYEQNALQPGKFDHELNKKHTLILLPFYVYGALLFIVVVFLFGIFKLDFAYMMPLALGAMEGVPISYYLMERGVFS